MCHDATACYAGRGIGSEVSWLAIKTNFASNTGLIAQVAVRDRRVAEGASVIVSSVVMGGAVNAASSAHAVFSADFAVGNTDGTKSAGGGTCDEMSCCALGAGRSGHVCEAVVAVSINIGAS